MGSYGVLGPQGLLRGDACTLSIRVHPTLALARRQVIVSSRDASGSGLELELTPASTLRARVGTEAGEAVIETASPIPYDRWSQVVLVVDGGARRLSLRVEAVGEAAPPQQADLALTAAPRLATPGRRLSLGSAGDLAPVDTFNGRLEDPWLLNRPAHAGDGATGTAAQAAAAAGDACVAAWDFSREMSTRRLVDVGPHGHHGELVNTPTRAVRGSRWTGREHCYRHAPDQYAGIHFHDDDLDDCRWPATHAITIPDGLDSDAYALMLSAGGCEENLPFFVVPPRGTATAKIAVLVSTYTYTIYGNHARPEWDADPAWRAAHIAQTKAWGAYAYNPGEHRDYGLSTYNYHTDRSGIGLVSWRRPMLNLRIGYLTYPYPEIRASGLRHYPADSHLLMWLAHQGSRGTISSPMHELHQEGARAAGDRYQDGGRHRFASGISHRAEMLDALLSYPG